MKKLISTFLIIAALLALSSCDMLAGLASSCKCSDANGDGKCDKCGEPVTGSVCMWISINCGKF